MRKRHDAHSYTVRFTPRLPGSIWSIINTTRMTELIKQGRVQQAGRQVFVRRDKKKSKLYSYEVGSCQFDRSLRIRFAPTAGRGSSTKRRLCGIGASRASG